MTARALALLVLCMSGCAGRLGPPSVLMPRKASVETNRDATVMIIDPVFGGSGTGVVISKQGLLLTNAHVVRGMRFPHVLLATGKISPATVVATEPAADLALVVSEAALPAETRCDGGALALGETVYSLGFFRYGRAYIQGVVMDPNPKPRTRAGFDVLEGMAFLQLPMSKGMSGSGVFSKKSGKLAGITGIKLPDVVQVHGRNGATATLLTGMSPTVVVTMRLVRDFLAKNGYPRLCRPAAPPPNPTAKTTTLLLDLSPLQAVQRR